MDHNDNDNSTEVKVDNDNSTECVRIGTMMAQVCWRRKWLRYLGTYDDALQEGILAALTALQYYNPNRTDSNFKSYICNCVFNHLTRMSIEARIIRVPRSGRKSLQAEKAFNIKYLSDFPLSYYDVEIKTLDENNIDYGIDAIMKNLNSKDKKLICQNFGIGCNRKTLEQLSKRENVTRQAMSRRRRTILKRIRERR